MFVHSGFLRRGVATALLQAVEDAALAAGLSRLYSEISFTARPFFEENGFRICGGEQVTFDDGSDYGFRMEKAL
jgi:putative acetyltransferase